MYVSFYDTIDLNRPITRDTIFKKIKLTTQKGYLFEITLTENSYFSAAALTGITGAVFEVFNNTKHILTDSFVNNFPSFKVFFENKNHYTILIRKAGFIARYTDLSLNINGCAICFDGVKEINQGTNTDENLQNFSARIEMEPAALSNKFVFENIIFESGKSNIIARSSEELTSISEIIYFNPDIDFELDVHTDSRGSDVFNLQLSQDRADSIYNYLKQKSCNDLSNLTLKAYGETQILNHCKDNVKCNYDQHKINRRVELKITGKKSVNPSGRSILKNYKDYNKSVLSSDLNNSNSEQTNKNNDTVFISPNLKNNDVYSTVSISGNNPTKIKEEIIEEKMAYYVIAGSFKNIENALKVIENLKVIGITGKVQKLENLNMFRVIAGEFKNEVSAREMLIKLRKIDISAFIQKI